MEHPYSWSERLKKEYDNCPGHKQAIDISGEKIFCDECDKPRCCECGCCIDEEWNKQA